MSDFYGDDDLEDMEPLGAVWSDEERDYWLEIEDSEFPEDPLDVELPQDVYNDWADNTDEEESN